MEKILSEMQYWITVVFPLLCAAEVNVPTFWLGCLAFSSIYIFGRLVGMKGKDGTDDFWSIIKIDDLLDKKAETDERL